MREHIVSTYDDDLNTLKAKLLEMGVLVERHRSIINPIPHCVKKVPENYLTDSIYQLGQLVVKNYSKALSSFDQDSHKIAQVVPTEDVTINSVYETCFREHLHLMMEDREIIGFSTQMLFIAKELERIGDLSKVISKEVIYNLKGKITR